MTPVLVAFHVVLIVGRNNEQEGKINACEPPDLQILTKVCPRHYYEIACIKIQDGYLRPIQTIASWTISASNLGLLSEQIMDLHL